VENFFGLPEALTSTAKEIDNLFYLIFWITLVVFILVEALLVIFLIRYKRKHPDQQGKPIHGSTKAEVIWTLIPAIILVFIGVYSSGMVYTIQDPDVTDPYEIQVVGFKWAWEFHYPNGAKTVNQLHIPEGKDVLFRITSKDVIHSFWIPEFRMKQDAVPGRETNFYIKADKIGEERVLAERIVCAEYCGDNHSKMLGDVIIQPQADFDTWVAAEKTRKKTDGYEIAIDNGCLSCHTIDGGKSAGPTWKGLFGSERELTNGQKVKVDAEYIKESILNASAKVAKGFGPTMPSYEGQLDDEQIENLVKYFEKIK